MSEGRTSLEALLRNLDEEAVLTLVRDKLARGEDPIQIMEQCQAGVQQVGELYEQHRYFVSGLIMAGEIMRQVVELIEPALQHRTSRRSRGTILLGTVEGDIHDIGKNLVGTLLRCNGFEVVDIGVDVPPATFLARAQELNPLAVGLSALLTTTFDTLRDTVALLRAELGPVDRFPAIIIGGGSVDENVLRYTAADHWAPDAASGLRLCEKILEDPRSAAPSTDA